MDKFKIIGGLVFIAGIALEYLVSYEGLGIYFGLLSAVGISFILFGKNLFQKKH